MAFSKKKKRKIIVDEQEFFWAATGNDGWISLCVMSEIKGGSKLLCKFDYHHIPIEITHNGRDLKILANQFVITPNTVRQAIEYALSIGWKPVEKGADLNLGHIDEKIDLKLDKNRNINSIDFFKYI